MKLIIFFILILIILYALKKSKEYSLDGIKDVVVNSAKKNNLDILNLFEGKNKGYEEKKMKYHLYSKNYRIQIKLLLKILQKNGALPKIQWKLKLKGN